MFALMLAEDWPWRTDELAVRLRLPVDLIGLAAATLQADGLVVTHGDKLRASWAAVRGDELACWGDSIKRLASASLIPGAAIPLH